MNVKNTNCKWKRILIINENKSLRRRRTSQAPPWTPRSPTAWPDPSALRPPLERVIYFTSGLRKVCAWVSQVAWERCAHWFHKWLEKGVRIGFTSDLRNSQIPMGDWFHKWFEKGVRIGFTNGLGKVCPWVSQVIWETNFQHHLHHRGKKKY